MKKNIFLILVTTLLSLGAAQAAQNFTKCYGDDLKMTATKTGNSYQWYKDGVKITGATSQSYTAIDLTANAKFTCEITTNGTTANTGNMIPLGNFEWTADASYKRYNQTITDPIRNESYTINYELDNLQVNQANSGEYTTTTNPNLIKSQYFSSITAKEGSRMLIVDGAASSTEFKVFHVRNLRLKKGQTYQFSCWAANVDKEYFTENHGTQSLPKIKFVIEADGHGTQVLGGGYMTLTDELGIWKEYKATFTPSQDCNWAHITIFNTTNTTVAGNDFVLDGLYFGAEKTTGSSTEKEDFNVTVYDTFEYKFDTDAVCPGAQATITTTLVPTHGGTLEPTANYKYEWKLNGTTPVVSTNKDLVVTAPNSVGTFSYVLSTSSSVCYTSGAKSQTISIDTRKSDCGTTATATKGYTPCSGTTCTLEPKSTFTTGTVTWKDASGSVITDLNISITSLTPLVYTCIIETTAANGTPHTITETHTIRPQDCDTTEEATINYPAQCKGTPITLTAQAEGTYLWQNGTTTRTIAIDEASDQTMTCIVTQNNGGITNTITETHIVKTIECRSTTMCNTGDSILKAQVTGDYYEWTLADGITKETIYTTNALTISPVTASAGDILTYTCEVYEYPATTSTLPSARPPMLIATESFVVTITNCKTQATDREQVKEDGSITIEVPGENRCMNCTYRWYKIDTNGNITVLQDSEIPTYTYNNAKDGEIFCDVKDDQERISHTQKYIIVTYKPEPESICYDTELTKTLEGETSETDNYEWYWLKNDTEVEFPAEAITIEGNKATLNLEYFVKQTNSTEPIVVNVLQKYEVEVEVSTTEGRNNEGGEGNEEEGESDDTGTHRLAQIDELEIYFEQKVTDISSVNDTKKILISDNGTLEEYDDTYFKISDSYIYQDPFGSKVGNMDSHEGHLKFTDTPMNAPQAYTGDRADNKFFVEVDGGDTAGPVFSIIANGKISKGDKYIFSFLATDTSGYPTESPADIQFTININNSDDIDLTPRLLIDHNGWKRYTYPFEVPLDGEEVIITLSNYNTSSGQNDFAIDEITFTLDKTTDLIPDVALPEDRSLKLRNSELRNSEFQMWRKEFSIIINQVTSESIIETAGLNKEFEKEVELPNETITFIYDPNTSQVNGRTYQDYKVSTNQYGCEHHVYFTLNLVSIEPMIFFSPNNDGLNDLWLVKGIESAPDAYIMIYDRYSKLLYKCKGSEFTGWDGNYNGHGMVQDDYWYVISIPETEEQISGHFTLKR